jgi:non-homologous end joining protein Ku
MFALNRAYDLVEVQTGHVVEKVTVRTIERHRHFHGVSLDSVVKCMMVRAFEDFIDRVYEKKDGSGVRVERKISRDLEVDELLEMLQKGAPAFETAHSVFELGQTIEKLITAMRHVAHRQATLEDQANIMTRNVTNLVESLEKALQPKEPTTREEPAPRDQVPFYS